MLIAPHPSSYLALTCFLQPDSASSRCDNLQCRKSFHLFERRHHCRMCGSLFCGACTTRTTALLDTSRLHFYLIPRGHSVYSFASSVAPVADARVCDACHDHVHGIIPRLPLTDAVRPPRRTTPRRMPPSPSSSLSASLSTPPEGAPLVIRDGTKALHTVRRNGSGSHLAPSKPRRRTASTVASPRHSPRTRVRLLPPLGGPPALLADIAPELAAISYGELDAYPLRLPSAICKAVGGGRWEPKPVPPVNIPYGKPGTADFCGRPRTAAEIAEAHRLENPVIVDGEFHIRYPGPPPPPPQPWFPIEATF
jgi:hypothetical protein